MDQILEAEQQHLDEVYAKLQDIKETTQAAVDARLREALEDRERMIDELATDFGNGVNLETYVEYEAMHKIIDGYNLANDIDAERLAKANLLLKKPYFAKVTLKYAAFDEPRDIYIGGVGMTDENCRHFVVDWRSPVAEVYYNQANGATSYEANGRTIHVDLQLRRQFDIDRNHLNACFDTTIAIEDPLLLASLSRQRSAQLQDITATIQKEQNEVIRHEDVPALLVNGIAGSGKTSILLQRISYLFYRLRDTLDPSDVYLITPNPVFRQYIDDVLPNMGERNPHILTWDDLMEACKLGDRGLSKGITAEALRAIDQGLPTLELERNDFQDIRVDDERVITAAQAYGAYRRFKRFPTGTHRATLTIEELAEKLEQRITRLASDEETQDTLADLTEEEQIRIFGHMIFPQDDSELREYTRRYLEDRYAPVAEAIEDGAWLRIDRIGMRLLGKQALDVTEWLYLKLALAGGNNRHAKFVMVDEVQDYTESQLMVLSRYFNNAHFLLLGDENQAIKPETATFPQIRDIFAAARGSVSECRLMTSYRSSPEITALFTSLMDSDERIKVSSVQREGVAPRIETFEDQEAYLATLRETVRNASEQDGLTAIITVDKARAKWLSKQLKDLPVCFLKKGVSLPSSGVVLMDVTLAKGLEFDRVIIPDAQESAYGDDALSRRRLYTAISRATREVTLLSQGALTPLLKA